MAILAAPEASDAFRKLAELLPHVSFELPKAKIGRISEVSLVVDDTLGK